VLFEQTHRLFVDGGAAHADAGRRAEDVQEALPSPAPAAAAAREERGRFVAAFIARDSQVRQGALSPRA
jgi:hypothetical protein